MFLAEVAAEARVESTPSAAPRGQPKSKRFWKTTETQYGHKPYHVPLSHLIQACISCDQEQASDHMGEEDGQASRGTAIQGSDEGDA